MARLIFFLEEPSMKAFLEELLPRLFSGLSFLCIPHEGKDDLEKSLSRKLNGWNVPGDRFCIVRDSDGADCVAIKSGLRKRCEAANRDALIRIVCQELEAWYFGDPEALATGFDREDLARIGRRRRFRDPDEISKPSSALEKLIPEFGKISGARIMGRHLTRDNNSRSYRVFLEGVERLIDPDD